MRCRTGAILLSVGTGFGIAQTTVGYSSNGIIQHPVAKYICRMAIHFDGGTSLFGLQTAANHYHSIWMIL